jgi:hypothetical protein
MAEAVRAAETAEGEIQRVAEEYAAAKRRVRHMRKDVARREDKVEKRRDALATAEQRLLAAEREARRQRINRNLVIATLTISAIAGGFLFARWFSDLTERRPATGIAIAAGVASIGLGVLAILRYRDDKRSIMAVTGAGAVLLWVGLFVVFPAVEGPVVTSTAHSPTIATTALCPPHSSSGACGTPTATRSTGSTPTQRASLDARLRNAAATPGRFAKGPLNYRLLEDQDPGPNQ